MEPMIIDGFVHQLPDVDPEETQEWIDSLSAVVDAQGKTRARFLMSKLLERARELQVGHPATVSTPYVNTIPPEQEPWFPGDEHIERRIRAYIRWNAAVMVVKANKHADGIGGHLSTYASSASLYEVGFNWFFHGKDGGLAGDHIYIQGHATPGIYARAFLERRLTEEQLDNFRLEIGGNGLSSYPHPRLMPEFWEFPTVSMGLGGINSIYQARFNRYLLHRRIADTSDSKVWAFLGDGECDEPETLGSSRDHSFAPDPRLRKMVDHLSDDDLRTLPRGGHDYRKLYAAYKAATEHTGSPTVILAKTVKGWTLGPTIEARNATHQIKKMSKQELLVLRDRLYLQEQIPEEALDEKMPPYY